MQELVWYIGMQRNAHKELKKRSQYIYIGFLFVLIAFFIGTLDYWDTKKIHAWDSVNTKLFFEQHPEDKEVLEEQIVQVSEEELPENTTESTNSEPTVANYYVGYLEIPKINLKRGFAAFGSPYNNVDKNVTILPTSVYPDVELGNFILAGHSGQGSLAFFNDLYKLKHGDQAIVYYKNVKYTFKIDAIAASAASVIAMAGNKVLMSPVAMLMIHDPSTIAMGNARDMEKAISTLNEVKESIINAYAFKTGLTHNRIAKLMENETWMNAKKAVELGFADEILFEAVEPEEEEDPEEEDPDEDGEDTDPEEEKEKGIHLRAQMYSSRQMGMTILNRLGVREDKLPVDNKPPVDTPAEPPAVPVLDLDGKTEDGSIPYNILLKQLECMR